MASSSSDGESQPQDNRQVQCCIAGCGPAGAMLGFLLARRGVEVLVLEKHGDFLRDFRGDTIHPSTLQIMAEVGLVDELMQLPHSKVPVLGIQTPLGRQVNVDFRHLKTRWPYIVFLPQWDFLNFLTEQAQRFPSFHLHMNAHAQELIEEDGEVCGIRYQTPDGWQAVRVPLTVAADGRTSQMREQAGLKLLQTSPPMDVLWFRLSRKASDPDDTAFYFDFGHIIGLINRGTYWQIAYVIAKGSEQQVRDAGLELFRQSIGQPLPWLADRVDELQTWEQVKLLVVQANRLSRWYRPGLLCIGDAAHAMSPVGGVGINLAIQDAVVAANVLTKPLQTGRLRVHDLAVVQRQREWPTRIIQRLQSVIQQRIGSALSSSEVSLVPAPFRVLLSLPGLRNLPARLIGIGVWPVHVRN